MLSSEQYDRLFSQGAPPTVELKKVEIQHSVLEKQRIQCTVFYDVQLASPDGSDQWGVRIPVRLYQQYLAALMETTIIPQLPDSLVSASITSEEYIQMLTQYFNQSMGHVVACTTLRESPLTKSLFCKPQQTSANEFIAVGSAYQAKIRNMTAYVMYFNTRRGVNSTIGGITGSLKNFLRDIALRNEKTEYNYTRQEDASVAQGSAENPIEEVQDDIPRPKEATDEQAEEPCGDIPEIPADRLRGKEFRAHQREKQPMSLPEEVQQLTKLLKGYLGTFLAYVKGKSAALRKQAEQTDAMIEKQCEHFTCGDKQLLAQFKQLMVIPLQQAQQRKFLLQEAEMLERYAIQLQGFEDLVQQLYNHLICYQYATSQLGDKQKELAAVQARIARTDKNKNGRQWEKLNAEMGNICGQCDALKSEMCHQNEKLARVYTLFRELLDKQFKYQLSVQWLNEENQILDASNVANTTLLERLQSGEDVISLDHVQDMFKIGFKHE